jgi:hypothetical protein
MVTIASLFANDASLDGVTRRFLEDERGGPLDIIGDTSSISAADERVGVDGVAMSDLPAKEKSELKRGENSGRCTY